MSWAIMLGLALTGAPNSKHSCTFACTCCLPSVPPHHVLVTRPAPPPCRFHTGVVEALLRASLLQASELDTLLARVLAGAHHIYSL